MASLWFWIVAVMITTYVVLDGFDLGAGAIYLFAAKTNDERRRVLRAIGPVWDGNEVWLLAAGGTLYFAFLNSTRRASAASTFADHCPVAADSARIRQLSFAPTSKIRSGRTSSTWSSAFPAFCWPCFSGRHWVTWCAEFRSIRAAISLSRSGLTSNSARRQASSIGTQYSPA